NRCGIVCGGESRHSRRGGGGFWRTRSTAPGGEEVRQAPVPCVCRTPHPPPRAIPQFVPGPRRAPAPPPKALFLVAFLNVETVRGVRLVAPAPGSSRCGIAAGHGFDEFV